MEAVVVGEVEAAVGEGGDVVWGGDLGVGEGLDVFHVGRSGFHFEEFDGGVAADFGVLEQGAGWVD